MPLWYYNASNMSHVETYTNEKKMRRDVENAAKHGWVPQTSAGTAGHVHLGRKIGAGLLFGPAGLLFGG
jgi:hypothetical protein